MISIAIALKVLVVIAVLTIHGNSFILHNIFIFLIMLTSMLLWCYGVVVINTVQLHSTEFELRFCEVQTMLVVCQRSAMVRISDKFPAGNKAKRLTSINHTTQTIHHHVL